MIYSDEEAIHSQAHTELEPVCTEPLTAEPAVEEVLPPAEEEAAEQMASDVESLRKEVEQLQAQAQEYLDGWQRARAELANARRRFEKERAEAGLYANAELVRKLLPISDDFERALAVVPEEVRGQPWTEGFFMIHRKLQLAFESAGVLPIPVQPGDVFDPTVHEAVTHEEDAGYATGAVIAEVQKGYRLGENVLRPALVRVAK